MEKTIESLIKHYKKNYLDEANDLYKQLEVLKNSFSRHFDLQHIQTMNIDEYVLGKDNKDSFCYWLEYKLHLLGEIRGPNAEKYGVYYSKDSQQYEYTKKFSPNNDPEEAFENVRTEIIFLIEKAKEGDYEYITKDCKLSDTIKGKIAFLYCSGQYLDIYSLTHLSFFLKAIGKESSKSAVKMQQSLRDWKNQHPIMRTWTNFAFADFLYKEFGTPPSERKVINELYSINELAADERLNEDISISDSKKINPQINDIPEQQTEPVIKNGIRFFPRNPKNAIQALVNADFKCELNNSHISFPRQKDGRPYMEAHHLIPMSQSDSFKNSIDITANIICLCSNCHNQIHYGKKK